MGPEERPKTLDHTFENKVIHKKVIHKKFFRCTDTCTRRGYKKKVQGGTWVAALGA